MEQNLHSPEVYDFRQYDRIWQRVAPGLEPYPTPQREGAVPAAQMEELALTPAQSGQMTGVRQESQLPGAVPNPCCMGSAAAEMLEVLVGFIEEELADRCSFLALARRAPSWARGRLRIMADEEGAHARRLAAVYYLITGQCYHPGSACRRQGPERWCEALRERYHASACNGLNYRRTGEETTDPCLSKLLRELSEEEYRHGEILLNMLERSLRE